MMVFGCATSAFAWGLVAVLPTLDSLIIAVLILGSTVGTHNAFVARGIYMLAYLHGHRHRHRHHHRAIIIKIMPQGSSPRRSPRSRT